MKETFTRGDKVFCTRNDNKQLDKGKIIDILQPSSPKNDPKNDLIYMIIFKDGVIQQVEHDKMFTPKKTEKTKNKMVYL